MALRTDLFNETTFKVVEINNVLALRTGHMLAQAELPKAKFLGGSETYIQNGEIVFLGIDGKLATRNQLADNAVKNLLKPFLVYNEELMTGPYTDLKYFAEVFDAEDKAYPRALGLEVGDAFTTDNYVLVSGTTFAQGLYAIINAAGKLEVRKDLTVNYVGPLFAVVGGDLPDGTTAAYEFTLIANGVTLSAD
jgi:hypothetical protein